MRVLESVWVGLNAAANNKEIARILSPDVNGVVRIHFRGSVPKLL